MKAAVAAIVALAMVAGPVSAVPAPWYKWRSKVDGTVFCAQTSPGDGWERASGPYRDARCETPGRPGE